MALPFEHPPLMPDEPLQVFVARIAHHYRTDLVDYCNVVGIPLRDLVAGRDRAIDRVAVMTGIDAPTLAHQAFRRIDNLFVAYRGQVLERGTLRRVELQGCPACLRDDIEETDLNPATAAYVRGSWLVRAVRTCPKHGLGHVPLSVSGRSFGGRGSYDGPSRLEPVLDRLDLVEAVAVPRSVSRFETYVLTRLEGGGSGPELIDAMPLHAAIQTCEVIGAVALHGPKVPTGMFDDDDWRAAGSAGFDVAAAGPEGITSLLSALQRSHRHGKSRNGRARDIYGRLYGWLHSYAKGPGYALIREFVREHILDTMPFEVGANLLGTPVDRRRVHSISTACHDGRKVSKRLSRELKAIGLLREGIEGDRQQVVDAPAEDVDAIVATLFAGLSKSEAKARMGLEEHQFSNLLKAGLLSPIVPQNKSGRTQPRFSPNEVEGFMRRVDEIAPIQPEVSAGALPISTISLHSGVGMTDILEYLFARGRPAGARRSDAIGYPSIHLDEGSIGELVRDAAKSELHFSVVARRLQVTEPVPAALVEKGFLRTVTVVNRRTHRRRQLITNESFDAFASRMVSLADLSRAHGVHHQQMRRMLEQKGVKPEIPSGKLIASFYRRNEVEQVFPRKISPEKT